MDIQIYEIKYINTVYAVHKVHYKKLARTNFCKKIFKTRF